MERLNNITPGEILLKEFLLPLHITICKLSIELNLPQSKLSEIIYGNSRISADTALRLAAFFGNTAKFWLGLQNDYDLENEMQNKSVEIQKISKIDIKDILNN